MSFCIMSRLVGLISKLNGTPIPAAFGDFVPVVPKSDPSYMSLYARTMTRTDHLFISLQSVSRPVLTRSCEIQICHYPFTNIFVIFRTLLG